MRPEILKIAEGIESYLTIPQDSSFLIEKAMQANQGIIEVGCWTGRSSVLLAEVAREKNIPYFAVDTWTSCDLNPGHDYYPEWRENMAKGGFLCDGFRLRPDEGPISIGITAQDPLVAILRMPSIIAARLFEFLRPATENPLWKPDFIFIDADHAYNSIRSDFLAWTRHLTKGGTVCFHDVNQPEAHPGVGRFFDELVRAGYPGTRKANVGAVEFRREEVSNDDD